LDISAKLVSRAGWSTPSVPHTQAIVSAVQSTPLLDCPINVRSTSLNASESTQSITTRGWCSGNRISCIGCVCKTSIERREERSGELELSTGCHARARSCDADVTTQSQHCRLILPDFSHAGISLLVRSISWNANCSIRPCSLESLPWISLQFLLYTETIQPHYNLLNRLYFYLKAFEQRCSNSSVLSKTKMMIRPVCLPHR
jgi:hypothetical protein